MKKRLCCVTLLAIVAMFASIPVLAYDNDARDEAGNGLLKGGPHRTINALALQQWIKTSQEKEPAMKRWGFDYPLMLSGPGVLKGGLELPTYGERIGDFQWWIAEGGYTADEPELFASFRHFFDPKAVSGALFLTDHLDTFDRVYRVLLPATTLAPTGISDMNPEINARDWGLTGEQNKGVCENDYSWKKGTQYIREAFAEQDTKKKEALFAQAWRACGETMHLIADMTCVPHVRNDSHPGKAIHVWMIGNQDPNLGYLKNDPYELYTNAEVIIENKDASVDPVAKALIDAAGDPLALFNNLATYTQDHFFSAETVSGTYIRDKGAPTETKVTVVSANGMKSYPLPRLADCDFNQKSGLFTSEINHKKILMCSEDWMSSLGWADPAKCGPGITKACTSSEASILVPVAIYANTRLLDWFIPRMELSLNSLDPNTKVLSGTFTHIPNIVHTEQLHYLPADKQYYELSINYTTQSGVDHLFRLNENGDLRVDLSGFPLKEKDKVTVGIGVGGMVIHSREFVVGAVQEPEKPH